MTAPGLRVVVAGAPAAQALAWTHALAQRAPRCVTCVPWPVSDGCEADLVLFLAPEPLSCDASTLENAHALRASLSALPRGYQVIQPPDTLQQALHAIGRALLPLDPAAARPLLRAERPSRWQGPCERCGDPDCEHRLFTRWIP